VLYNPIVNLVIPETTHVMTNLVFVAVVGVLAWKAGANLDNLGLRVDMVGRGSAVGGVALAVIAVGVIALTALPGTREFFADDRFVGVGFGEMVYESVVRIPLGTVAVEELLFRGIVVGLLLRRWPIWVAASIAAVLFGLWHVIPTFDAIGTNPAGAFVDGPLAVAGSVLGAVIFTAFVGYLFTWLRFRGNSLVAPMLAHAATNSFGFVAGWLVVTQGWA
jgi:membrane protease YdiL (CAAX protease family)